MPVVLLVRHGQASYQAEDYDQLSDLGCAQADAVGRWLRRQPLRTPVVAHGSLRRQRETAEIALTAAGLDLPRMSDDRWDEYDHVGLVRRYAPAGREGQRLTSAEFQVLLDQALREWIAADEDWPGFREAGWAALASLLNGLADGRDAVVFTSAGVIAALCSRLLQAGAETVVAMNRVAVNGAVSKVIAGRGGLSLLTFNEHSHVGGELLTYR